MKTTSRNNVELVTRENEQILIIEPIGIDKIWSFTTKLEFPLTHVKGASHDTGLQTESRGMRAPGLHFFNKCSGIFYNDEECNFMNINGYENVLAISLHDEKFDMLYISVENPEQLARQINAAIHQ